MKITIQPRALQGNLRVPPSKSCAHRAFICGALAKSPTGILCGQISQDVAATIRCLQALGAKIEQNGDGWLVTPISSLPEKACLPCGESGSTLRFLLPIAGALGVETTFRMEGRLPSRPLSPLWEELERMGCRLSCPTSDTVLLQGQLKAGIYHMDGAVSSQFISGLMLAMPLLGDSFLELQGPIQSRPYVDLTADVMARFPQGRSPGIYRVEGDWSSAAFFLAANRMGSQISLSGLDLQSRQGDQAIVSCLTSLGNCPPFSAGDIPDLIPILAVAAAFLGGCTFTDISRLRLKESDRVASILSMLRTLGGQAQADENTLTVFPVPLTGGTVDPKRDHRIAMAAAIAATGCLEPVTILDAECTAKSYPKFWEDYQSLGGIL